MNRFLVLMMLLFSCHLFSFVSLSLTHTWTTCALGYNIKVEPDCNCITSLNVHKPRELLLYTLHPNSFGICTLCAIWNCILQPCIIQSLLLLFCKILKFLLFYLRGQFRGHLLWSVYLLHMFFSGDQYIVYMTLICHSILCETTFWTKHCTAVVLQACFQEFIAVLEFGLPFLHSHSTALCIPLLICALCIDQVATW
jgi:hypothetical protein